ncbi:MAG: dihydropteroate synthase-like protein [Methanolinea sp.]|jgi:dihydropteroate synthase-like protein|nr:dihydropteroate synthase-like protein [Methanolinea sp.]
MRILLPTGRATYELVKEAAAGIDARVVVTGEIASFLSPAQLTALLAEERYDLAIVSGMCTASFSSVEAACGVPVYLGPRHAADLGLVLPLLPEVQLSRTIPADDFLAEKRRKEAKSRIASAEHRADFLYRIRGVKIGGGSRMKVLAEITDAHRVPDLRERVEDLFSRGADIVDLGFGFDATPGQVRSVFSDLDDLDGPLSVDTQDPALIAASLSRADLVLSLQEENIPLVGSLIARAGAGAVVVPGRAGLMENVRQARESGIECLLADPLLLPAGSGLVESLGRFSGCDIPIFFGAGNVVELLDADSVGANALLAAIAAEVEAAVIFSSEHSDKTRGSVCEMRRATEMMVLARGRPYPKDLGLDLLVIKEKRRRREPPLEYSHNVQARPAPADIEYDPRGNFRIGIEGREIVAVIGDRAYRGTSWADLFSTVLAAGEVSLLDHAAYLGKELYKAEMAIHFGRSFEQDGPF